MSDTSAGCNPTEFLNQLEDFLFSEERATNVHSSRTAYFEDQILTSESLRYLLEKDYENNNGLDENENTEFKFSAVTLREIDHRIQKKGEKILQLGQVGIAQREDLDMDIENESLSSKLDWIENTIRAQKKEMYKAKHYMTSMRQELANDYIDGFEEIYKTMNVMVELISDVVLSKELHRFDVFEEYMEKLTTSLTLKLSVLDATIHLKTYDKDTVRALQVIRSSLETQHSEIKAKIVDIEAKMEAYHSQGPDFKEIAIAYAQVISKIKDTKEHIARINNPY
ncbi:HAUS augmin-like complex subunit 4-domain-containing protein [Umbelopsis sp. AD052]|nr:HAUS augmin-like complex subunit 4-domain-containing protein [Umbelopsis sp. AD052]